MIGHFVEKNRKYLFEKYNYKCAICGSSKKKEIHHIDPVWNNKERACDIDNLMVLCRDCHARVHGRNLEIHLKYWVDTKKNLSNFFNDKKQFQAEHIGKIFNKKTTKLARQYERIKNIRYVGKEKVYDLEVTWPNDSKDKFSNFICNGFIVHNSPTVESTRYAFKDLPHEMARLEESDDYTCFKNTLDFVRKYTVLTPEMLKDLERDFYDFTRVEKRKEALQNFCTLLLKYGAEDRKSVV